MPQTQTTRQIIDVYLERVLHAQFDASDWIEHKPTKGTLRESFIKWLLIKEFPYLNGKIEHGIIIHDAWQSGEIDFVWLNDNARVGSMGVYDLCDCRMAIEIKSCAQKSEFVDANTTASQIKEKCPEPYKIKVGMFCYATRASKSTVLKQFGFLYDEELDCYAGYDARYDEYTKIDFHFSLDLRGEQPSPYFIMRDISGKCTLFSGSPVIANFLNMFK